MRLGGDMCPNMGTTINKIACAVNGWKFPILFKWYSGTMRALGSEASPSARVRILSECRLAFLTRGNGFLAGGL
ncbi:hypothetical protein E2C01_022092 [Portunus trituberculatus]|uniref:Uncharacterized protein n=1 Tax=Portunus trituberculatus TaxID=210409 RepID=A0A5B7E636_PORTR|nr:hypothetical protein [Portunus trituberculatus]